MEIESWHIKKLCKIIHDFHEENRYYPLVVSSPGFLESFYNYDHDGMHYIARAVLDTYRMDKRLSYMLSILPEGLVFFKLQNGVIFHRIFDLEKEEYNDLEPIRTSRFSSIDFGNNI